MKKLLLLGVLVVVSCAPLIAQMKQVTGKVTSSDDGSALPGVSVSAKGSSRGTTTSSDGSYSIQVADGASLVYSFVGYTSQTIAVGNRSVVNVS
ncbi:carboxypeptidase-like regulatory domain-containing protein [Aquirufa nivalisilvae]